MSRLLHLAAALALAGCSGGIYVRDGVTDGDTFFLAPQAFVEDDAVLQSWVTYSLMRSACQLEVGGPNPARVSTYACELGSRERLLDSWQEKRVLGAPREDAYLDALAAVREAGFLEEYVVHYLSRESWRVPGEVDLDAFGAFRRARLRGHKPEIRWIGSWGYRRAAANERAGPSCCSRPRRRLRNDHR
jgi:hypothetical protein